MQKRFHFHKLMIATSFLTPLAHYVSRRQSHQGPYASKSILWPNPGVLLRPHGPSCYNVPVGLHSLHWPAALPPFTAPATVPPPRCTTPALHPRYTAPAAALRFTVNLPIKQKWDVVRLSAINTVAHANPATPILLVFSAKQIHDQAGRKYWT
jgi:hypothetical protein